jgi:uncharacterized protein (TIGR04255 family)
MTYNQRKLPNGTTLQVDSKKGFRVDLPEPDRQLLDPAPARRVICQLRFETSDQVGTSDIGKQWADKLSDQLPGFDQLQSEVMTIQGGANQPAPRIEQSHERGWRFSDDGDQTVVTLLPASLALETSAYPGWDDFLAQFEQLLALLDETVGPAVEKRLGLRYINELSPGPDAVAAEVDREVLALRVHPQVGEGVVRVEQRAIVHFGDRKVASVRFLSSGEDEPSILDIDAYRESGRPFSTSAVRAVLNELNTHALSLFQACLSDEYLAELRADQGTA